MPDITVDPSLCEGEGLCTAVCTAGIYVADGRNAPRIGATELCSLCGHCLAICPKDAIRHSDLSLADFPLRPRGARVSPESLAVLLRGRRSVREWRDRPVPRELLERLLDFARYAPTASNAQDVRFVVIQDRHRLRELDRMIMGALLPLLVAREGATLSKSFGRLARRIPRYEAGASNLILHDAPALVVLHAPASAGFGDENCHYAAFHMVALAETLGLGTCFMGYLISTARVAADIAAALNVPPDRRVGTAFTLGYPKYRYRRLAGRNPANTTWL